MVGVGLGRNFERKRPPRWTAPVPETVCNEVTCEGGMLVRVRRWGRESYSSFLDGGAI